MTTAYIGIGSNLENRKQYIDDAITLLNDSESIGVKKVSTIYETEPMGGPPQGDYLNGVIEVETDFSPYDLLKYLNDIELRLGRVRTEHYGPRQIDLDILLYGDIKINQKDLTIPHPLIGARDFVLRGLREIAPHLNL